jgi:trans-L-3-hydroxyproline dehydratase
MNPGYLFNKLSWLPPENWLSIKSIDLHTGGEPLRILTHGLPEIKGDTILKKKKYFRNNFDFIRTGTMLEPRGHADMYGAIITEPVTENADFGTFFLHNEGYSTMCGHAIIALVKLVLDMNLIQKRGSNPEIIIDAPPGQIIARAQLKNGVVEMVRFVNVPSFVLYSNETVLVDGIGNVEFDIAFGGAFYAICESAQFGLKMMANEYDRMIDIGRRIKQTIIEKYEIKHPFEDDLSFLYGTIFTGPAISESNRHSRNVCIFANGEVDRSATGSGVSARAALLHAKGELQENQRVTIESILGTTMVVEIKKLSQYGPYNAVIPEVGGSAFITGQNTFYFDPEDPLGKGFIFR